MMRSTLAAGAATLALACADPSDTLRRGTGGTDGGGPGVTDEEKEETPAPICPGAGRAYVGIGGADLRAGRVDREAGLDRGRVKPYSALPSELARVLGEAPASVGEVESAFGDVPDRWYVEPSGSAMGIYAAHRVAFDGCLTLTAAATAYGQAPTKATATTECTRWATRAWSRRPDQTEIDACVSFATEAAAGETDPRRRWAEVCAAIVSSAGFLTY
jgi:hypothetical protein